MRLLVAVLLLTLFGAHILSAAEIPLPASRPMTMTKQESRALRALIAKGRMSQGQFERSLLSAHGKSRLE